MHGEEPMIISRLYLDHVRLREPLSRDDWPARLPAVRSLAEGRLTFSRPVTFFVGKNGSGTSTLAERRVRGNGLYLLDEGEAELFQFTEQGVARGAYRETEHYQITRRFLEQPGQMLRYLLD